MPNILMLFEDPLGAKQRPTRMFRVLRELGTVTVCCSTVAPYFTEPATHLPLPRMTPRRRSGKIRRHIDLLLGMHEHEIWSPPMRATLTTLTEQSWDMILCRGLELLPMACSLRALPRNRGRCKLLVDAAEYYPRQFENQRKWRLLFARKYHYICKKYMTTADAVFTVSPGLAAEYKKQYGIDCRLLLSLPEYHDLTPRPVSEGGQIRCIHHGNCSPGRKLENMIEAIALAGPRFSLDLMLAKNNPEYIEVIKQKAAGVPGVAVLEPVPMPEVIRTTAIYDIGIFLLEPNTFNHRHCLPNKLFEFIQARLAVVISPNPDMAALVREYGVGTVAKDFSPASMAQTLRALAPEQIMAWKKNSCFAAQKFCAEKNVEIIHDTIASLGIL